MRSINDEGHRQRPSLPPEEREKTKLSLCPGESHSPQRSTAHYISKSTCRSRSFAVWAQRDVTSVLQFLSVDRKIRSFGRIPLVLVRREPVKDSSSLACRDAAHMPHDRPSWPPLIYFGAVGLFYKSNALTQASLATVTLSRCPRSS